MTQPTSLPYEPPAAAPATRKKRGRFWLIGCGGALLAVILGIGTCALAVKGGMATGEKELGPVCDRYLNEVSVGDYNTAYSEADSVLRASTTEKDFARLERGIQERNGALRSKKVSAVQAGVDGQGRWGRLVYRCEFDKGPGTIRFDLRKRSDGWKITLVRYDSAQLEESIRSLLQKTSAPSAADE
jgi:hypothetical protein